MADTFTAITASGSTAVNTMTGWCFRETTGTTPAVVRIRNGGDAGAIVVSVSLSAGESVGENYSDFLVSTGAWYVQVVSGAVEGSVYGT